MAKIVWYEQFSTEEENNLLLTDYSGRGNNGEVHTTFYNYPGKGKVLDFDAENEYVKVLEGDFLWNWDFSFNWTWANRTGLELTDSVNGHFDNAFAGVYNDSGTYKVLVPDTFPGHNTIAKIRGVYLSSEEFSWDNIWAEPFNSNIVNYYSSHTVIDGRTYITLTDNPGSTVQLWYTYKTGDVVDKYTGLNIWPYVKNWKNADGTYLSMWAVDKVLDLFKSLFYYEKVTGRSTLKERNYVWELYKQYTPERIPPLITDDYNRDLYNRGLISMFRNSTSGNSSMIFPNFDIYTDGNDKYLNLQVSLPTSSDAAWTGYWVGVDNLSISPWNTFKDGTLQIKYKGFNNGNILSIQLNGAGISDLDKYTNQDYIYTHYIPDYFVDWTEFSIPYNNFWRMTNIYSCPFRTTNTWWGNSNAGTINVQSLKERFTVDDEIFYGAKGIEWSACTWAVIGTSNYSAFDLTQYSNINFLIKFQPAFLSGYSYQVQVVQTGDTEPRICNIIDNNSTTWHRVTIDFEDFDPPIDTSKQIEYIQILFASMLYGSYLSFDGKCYLTDIKFNDHLTYYDLGNKLYLVQYYVDGYSGTEHRHAISYIKFGPTAYDQYPHTPPLGITEAEYGLTSWQGITLVHYTSPLVPRVYGDTDIESTYVDFINDAQNRFHELYGGDFGPIMPCHTRNFLENIGYVGAEFFNDWSWFPIYKNYEKREAMWLFNESLIDSSGNNHTLQWSSGYPSYTSGICQPSNTSIACASTAHAFIESTDFLFGKNEFSIELVAKFNTTSGSGAIVGIWPTSNKSWVLYRDGSGLGFGYSTNGTSTNYLGTGSGVIDTSNYHKIILTRIGTSLNWFVDDVKVHTDSLATSVEFYNSTEYLTIGNMGGGGTWNFNGNIDFLAIHKRGFNDQEAINRSKILSHDITPSTYPEISYAHAQFWLFPKVAEYYYFTGATSVENYLEKTVDWLDKYIIEDPDYPSDPKGYIIPNWFFETGFEAKSFDPYVTASVAIGMLFYYWRTGNTKCNTWIRRLLDDLYNNRYDSSYGGYIHDGIHWGFGNGYTSWLFGLVTNGRLPGVISSPATFYEFASTSTDVNHFVDIIENYYFGHVGDTSPNVLNADHIPYTFAEDYDSWDYAPNYIYVSGLGTTESTVNTLYPALEYGRYTGDYSWFIKMKKFIITAGLNLENSFTLESWVMADSPHNGDIIHKDGCYSLYLKDGYPAVKISNGATSYELVGNEEVDYAQFNHICANYDGETLELLKNTKLIGSSSVVSSIAITSTDLLIGTGTSQFYGNIAEIIIKTDASTRSEIKNDMLRWPAREANFIIELIEINVDNVVYKYTNYEYEIEVTSYVIDRGDDTITYTYTPLPFERGVISRTLSGETNTTIINFGLTSEISTIINTKELRNKQIKVKSTYIDTDHTDPDNVVNLFIGYIDSWQVENDIVTLSCKDSTTTQYSKFPLRNYSYFCGHRFKGIKCMYSGPSQVCNKTLTQCSSLGNSLHFGGFKDIPTLMRSEYRWWR